MSEEQVKLNLYQKLVEIRKSIDFFTKDTKGFGYNYVSGSQVLKKIKTKMDELQVLLIPIVINQTHETFDYKTWDKQEKREKEKTDFIVTADMKYIWVNAESPEERLEVPWQTMGQQDDISKAFGSGLTYSERYFLLKFFGIPTDEEDPDARDTTGKKANNQSAKLASEKQLNLITSLLKNNVNDKYGFEDLHNLLKQKLGTDKNMEHWTSQEASKAINILQSKK
ncbi:ERF family protein [Caldifermentibacillus hisashii]|uniref:ERF family protein n=1 Tax=Caldifermentibacillus hisashii TaxID=996558 RepID=UPI0031FD0D70